MGQEFVVPSFNTNRYYNKNTDQIATLPVGATAGSVMFVGSDGTLDEDNANFFWDDTNNRLGIGTATPEAPIDIATVGTTGLSYIATNYSTNGAGPYIRLRQSRGTEAAPTIVSSGDDLGYLQFQGYDGVVFRAAANITASVDGTPGSSDMPGRLVFSTTADGSASLTERMRIDSLGRIKFGTAAAYSETGLTSQGVLYYGSTGGILTLAAFSSVGNTQFNLNTAVGSGTNATRFAISSTGAMALTPATGITATTNGSTNLTELASSTHTLIVTRTSTSDANYGIKLTNLGTSGYGSAINWEVYGSSATPNTYSAAQIKVENTGASGGGFLAFLTAPAASTTLAEVARLYNDTFLIGRTTGTLSNGILQVRATASASAAEKIARFDVSDDATGKLEILNVSSTDGVFQPGIRATTASTTEGLGIESAITTDTGAAAGMYFQSKTAAGAVLTTRPLFQWLNFGTVVQAINAQGKHTLTPIASTSGVVANWVLTPGANTGITASTESNVWRIDTATRTWATTGTVAAQRDVMMNGLTYASASASQTFTRAATLYATQPLAGSNAIITAAYASWFQATAVTGTQEKISLWTVSDDAVGSVEIINLSGTDAVFAPAIQGSSGSTTQGFAVRGLITTDTGTNAALSFVAATTSLSALATRPLFVWNNAGTEVMSITGTTAGNALKTSGGRIIATRVALTTPVTVATTDNIIITKLTSPAAVAVNLPASPETGREYIIKDGTGDATANNVTITPAAGTIDGAATVVINTNYGAYRLVYNGTEWNAISEHGGNIL